MKLDPKKSVLLIDGSSFLYRAYYSMRPLHTPSGLSVQAVYGFCRMLKKVLDMFQPGYIALVWDSQGPTMRTALYQAYKATRQAPPNDLFEQKELIMRFATQIGLCQIHQKGREADDIMFSIAQERAQEGDQVLFLTSDKDMAQALNERTFIYDTFKDRMIDEQTFAMSMGFPVHKLTFYYALVGDTSDNIPGVRGIGQKGATDLAKQFDSLEDLYTRIDQVPKERTRVLLQQQKEQAFLSRELFTLHYHPSGLVKKDMVFDPVNWRRARTLFQEWNFKSLLASADGDMQAALDAKKELFARYAFVTVVTQQQLQEVVAHMERTRCFALDTEGSGLQPLMDGCTGISLCMQEGVAYYIPFGHATNEQQLTRDYVIKELAPFLEDATYIKYLHYAKFDQEVLWKMGVSLRGVTFDTMIAANLVAPEGQRVGLKFLSQRYFNESMITYNEVMEQVATKDFAYVPLSLATLYAAADAHQTFRLQKILAQELEQDEELKRLFYDIEMPLSHVLVAMEIEGIYVDAAQLHHLGLAMAQHMSIVDDKIRMFIPDGRTINLNSPKQVEQLLFHELKLPPQKKSGKGTSFSTDQEVLTALSSLHPVPGLILAYRELAKLKNTYADSLPMYINPKTRRIHTSYNQISVATGRLASSDPNLQNIPASASGYGGALRAAFKPKEGHLFLSADYSQIELRILAYYSQDENLMHAFISGHDIHAQTAARLFAVPVDTVTNEQRQVGKRINFSVLYGLTPYGLSRDLGISFAQAKQYIETYFQQYPGVLRWMEEVVQETKRNGYVCTWQGRRRYLPGIYQENKTLYEEARRMAINTKAQGTAADIMKIGMIRLHHALQERNLDAHMLLQIHDELLISVHHTHKDDVAALTQSLLESVTDWNVPLRVSLRFGNNWQQASK